MMRMHHWFHLCEERTIRAIRLFMNQAGWVPHYTDSELDARYQPICFGPAHASRLSSP
jgi:1,2-dihydroxy-3-keto-5-methylthiopentene dioxygenase